jgi:AraC-like DNA-binding protein
MDYAEFEVPPGLRRHLQCVWRLRDAARRRDVQTIYPDGRCELIVHLAAPPRLYELGRGWRAQSNALFAAQHRAPIRLEWEGDIDCVGVRLRPAASAAVVAQPGRLRDRIVDLATVDPEFAPVFAAAAQRYCALPDDGAWWRLLEARVLPYPIDHSIEAAVNYLEAQDGRGRVEQAAGLAAMSLRTFQARFLACVGLGAKEFARMLRLQATLRALDRGHEPLSQVALDAGFADQAHATRELARLTGETPARLRAALQAQREGEDTLRMAAAFVRGQS